MEGTLYYHSAPLVRLARPCIIICFITSSGYFSKSETRLTIHVHISIYIYIYVHIYVSLIVNVDFSILIHILIHSFIHPSMAHIYYINSYIDTKKPSTYSVIDPHIVHNICEHSYLLSITEQVGHNINTLYTDT